VFWQDGYPVFSGVATPCYLFVVATSKIKYINDDDLIILLILLHLIKSWEYFTHYSNRLF
jgi:hypothetical protein